jgi:hypothetical protein
MTSALESTQPDLTFTAERPAQDDLAFLHAITSKTVLALRRLLPASMIALGAVATIAWGGLLVWLLFQIALGFV